MARKPTKKPTPERAVAVYTKPNGRHPPDAAKLADKLADKPAEKVPAAESLIVPVALMLAAESVSAKKDLDRPNLMGVFLQSFDKRVRIAGADGQRLFIGSFDVDGPHPAWLKDGLIVSNEGLRSRLNFLATTGDAPQVRLTHALGLPNVEMSDIGRNMVFQAPVQDGSYPDLDRVVQAHSFSKLDEEGRPMGTEWEPVGINSTYLKHIGEVAKLLDKGLHKEERALNKGGMVVRAFNPGGATDVPMVFDFSTWPGAILVIAVAKMATRSIPMQTAQLLTGSLKLTVAALRAHATRNLAWAERAASEADKAEFIARAEGFHARVADLLQRVPGLPTLAAPVPTPEPDATAEDATAQATDGEGEPDGEPDADPDGEPDGPVPGGDEPGEAVAA